MQIPPGSAKPPFAVFLALAVIVFVSSLSAADSIGFVPCTLDGTCGDAAAAPGDALGSVALAAELPQFTGAVQATSTPQGGGVEPDRILSSAIGLDLPVQNPKTTDKDALDTVLLKGPVRYADSGLLGVPGNIFIFAHSSRIPIVKNQMFKAFNRISELKNGDTIALQGGGRSYLYSVVSLKSVDVNTTNVDLSTNLGQHLTLVTCDIARGKDWRWLLEAHYVGTA